MKRGQEIFLALSVLEPDMEFARVFEADAAEWEEAARLSVVCRVFPVFLRNLKTLGLESRVLEKSLVTLRDLSGQTATRTAALLKFSDRLLGGLSRLGVCAIPLKGISVARYYPDPLLRPMSDIDLLIARSDFPGCRAALEDFGFYPVDPVRNGVFVNPGQECLFQDEKGFQVDVHYRFFPWFEEEFVYKIAVADFIERAVSGKEAAKPPRGLLPEDELYYLLLVLHRSRMRSFWYWTDLDALMRHFGSRLRGEHLTSLINRSPIRELLMKFMVHAESRLGIPGPGLLGALPVVDHAHRLKNSMLFPAGRHSRIEEKIFLWNCVRNPFDKLRLLSVFLKWQLFKFAGFFKREFLNAHNPTGEEIHYRWRLNKERFVSREIDEKRVVVDLQSGEYFNIDGTGGLIWDDLAAGKDLKSIVWHLTEVYEVNIRTAGEDVRAFLRRLKEAGLIG